MQKKFELGITTFADVMPDPHTGITISHAERIRQVVDEIVLADELGLDFYGVGEHHRADFAASAPAIILAAAAGKTKHITLGTAVSVLSTTDPIRLYQEFATIDAISHGRSELLVGRGGFTESFPLFGYELSQYEKLFDEHLDLLLQARDNEFVTWQGQTRSGIRHLGIYPRTEKPLSISMALGGSRSTIIKAGKKGLPAVLAVLGGRLPDFAQYGQLYRDTAVQSGHDPGKMKFSVHAHGFVLSDGKEAEETFFPYIAYYRSSLMSGRGLPPYSRYDYDGGRSPEGAIFVGGPQEVADKILLLRKHLGIDRFFIQMPVATMPHDLVLKAIKAYATEVAPRVRAGIQNK
ncbi:LLM class flavin-dependent oxidoreductase [Mucilaginibacter gossypii]|uniref:Probable oxidoreductase, LLM family n=1 Tax=Mucilaginibacter gossypii TaxID=551996 RepID=A0A1G8CRA8_9SPHI|nr:LLM class flavin-dependent oxidoreductase [Mucilaginibacter gossypii]SDH47972.1 probable oxidoreductase, LLM family [Mucilaginibacter gossypii]